jgi:uncharacterized protein YqfA (UPF0365 family)
MSDTFDIHQLAGLWTLLGQVNPPQGPKAANDLSIVWWILLGILLIVLLIFLVIFFSFIRLWIQSFLTGAKVGLVDMIRMKLCGVDYSRVVRWKIALVQAGAKVTTQEMESLYLSDATREKIGVERVSQAVIAAHKAGIDLPWHVAQAIQLAGRNILEAVQIYVNPRVINCPDPSKGKANLEGVCRNGIQLQVRARVTVRTKLDRLVGGATEETIIARVGEGIVKAIGSADHHTDVLANPNLISKAVLVNALDAQTAFEIVSVDVAEVDVAKNIGAELQVKQAEADLQVARAHAEQRRAAAVAREQEMRAAVEENRAKVVEAEANVPMAIADAFRSGRIGVMDYYNLRNLQSDTQMRNSIGGAGLGGEERSGRAQS